MHIVVGYVFNISSISMMSKSTKSSSVKISCEWNVTCDQTVDSHVKLFSTNKQRIYDVALNNIRLSLRAFRLPSKIVFPLGYLLELVEQENTLSLRLSNGFHDPDWAESLFKLLHKERIVTRKVISCWEKVKPILCKFPMFSYAFASSYLPSFSRVFLYLLRFLTIRSFLVNS